MKCTYCGKPAGWFHRSHAECRKQHETGRQQISILFKGYLNSNMTADQFGQSASEIANHHFVSTAELHSLAIAGFQDAVKEIIEHDLLSSKEDEEKLARLQKEFSLTQPEVGGSIGRLTNARHEAAQQQIAKLFRGYLRSDTSVNQLGERVRELAKNYSVSSAELHSLTVAGFQDVVDTSLEDQLVSKEEEARLASLRNEFALAHDELGPSTARLIKAATLRDLDAGIVQPRLQIEGLSINLRKDEVVLWLFNGTEIHELKSHTTYVGGSHGISMRIMRGLYYRVGAFKGERVQTQDLVRTD
jgi:hypothetical protein